MKTRSITLITMVAVLAALALPVRLAAQVQEDQNEQKVAHHRYKLFDVGTFGGSYSIFNNPSFWAVNNRGAAVGSADTPIPDPYYPNCYYDCVIDHGFAWENGVTTDLGTLPGGASSDACAINRGGLITGQSQNGVIDPLTGFPEAHAVVWRNGRILDLGTLGGNQSNTSAINDRGQVVGEALTAIPDPFAGALQAACGELPTTGGSCASFSFAFNSLYSPAATETHAFLWQAGFMRDLGTLGGPDSAAWINNQSGEIVGWSYTSFVANLSTGVPTVDPFIWSPENGKMTDLGGLGGTFGAAFFLNNRGQVVGISNLPGDTMYHPFIWSKSEGMKDLGTFGGDFAQPFWINDSGEVVGSSTNAGDQNQRAFLWRHGVLTDLGTISMDQDGQAFSINSSGQIVGTTYLDGNDNHGFLSDNGGPLIDLETLVLPGSEVTVISALVINDRGEIAGHGRLPNGDSHAILLIPCDDKHPNVEGCEYSLVDSTSEAQVRPAQLTPQSAAASYNTLPPAETMTRIRSSITNRNHRFGAVRPK